jgi:hypothetical protein
MGTRRACGVALARSNERPDSLHFPEASIRTLSVSLVAVAAIAASLLLTRNRDEQEAARVLNAGERQPMKLQLDAIRAAGL